MPRGLLCKGKYNAPSSVRCVRDIICRVLMVQHSSLSLQSGKLRMNGSHNSNPALAAASTSPDFSTQLLFSKHTLKVYNVNIKQDGTKTGVDVGRSTG